MQVLADVMAEIVPLDLNALSACHLLTAFEYHPAWK